MRLGVDIGRVIIGGDGEDTSFLLSASDEDAIRAPEVPGAIDAVARLVRLARAQGGDVWLVSKCGERVQAKTRAWLEHRGFWQATGIPETHLHFCRKRGEKAPIAVRLGLDAFVDDRLDVLIAMAGVVRYRLLFGATSSPVAALIPCKDWVEAESHLVTIAKDMTE